MRQRGPGRDPRCSLGWGYLTRPHEALDATQRGRDDEHVHRHSYRETGGPTINDRLQELRPAYDATMAQLAPAWGLHQDVVTTPIFGMTSIEHLGEAYKPVEVSGPD